MDDATHSPWMCHICSYTSDRGEATACSVCYMTTCLSHLRTVPAYNEETGLYELRPVCLYCATPGLS